MVALSLLFSLLAHAAPPEEPVPNILTNASFSSKLSDWKASPNESNSDTGTMAWSRYDAGDSKTSGSLALTTSATADRNAFRVGQCARLDKRSENLLFGGRIRVPADQKARGFASVELERFESTDCSGEVIPYEGLGGITNADFWSNRRELVAAAQAKSVRVVASVEKIYEWREGDEIGETDDGLLFRAYFDDLFVGPVLTPLEPAPEPPDASRFTTARAPKSARWGTYVVAAPTLALAVLGPDGKPHPEGITAECSSLESVRIALTLKNPYEEDNPRWYPLQPVALPGEGQPSARPTVELAIFRAGDKTRKLVPIVCDAGQPTATLRVLGDPSERVGGIREFYTCLRGSLPVDARQKVPEKPSDEELLAWPFAAAIVANPAGQYEAVARYQALEAGFWHEPLLSNTVKIRITRQAPCPPATP